MDTAIKIGCDVTKDSAKPVADAIAQILGCPGEQETIREALRTFARSVRVENITIQGANIDARTDSRTFNLDSFGDPEGREERS